MTDHNAIRISDSDYTVDCIAISPTEPIMEQIMIEPRRETVMQESSEASGIPDRRERRSITHPQWRDGVTCMPLRRHWRRLFRSTSLRGATRRFRRGQRGSVAIESALGITVLVISLAVVMEIVNAAYASDQMSRAARAAARSIALNPPADPDRGPDHRLQRHHSRTPTGSGVRSATPNGRSTSTPTLSRTISRRPSIRASERLRGPVTWSSSGSAGSAMP